jgi:hypothetical protein
LCQLGDALGRDQARIIQHQTERVQQPFAHWQLQLAALEQGWQLAQLSQRAGWKGERGTHRIFIPFYPVFASYSYLYENKR